MSTRAGDDALTLAYHHASTQLASITEQLEILPAYFGCLMELAKSSRAHLDLANVDAAGAGVLHIFEVLQDVATTYHRLVGELVSGEELPGSEKQLE